MKSVALILKAKADPTVYTITPTASVFISYFPSTPVKTNLDVLTPTFTLAMGVLSS